MAHSLKSDNEGAKKARITLSCVVALANEGLSYDFFIGKMLWGVLNYAATGKFARENKRTYDRLSDAAKALRDADPKGWLDACTFEHPLPLTVMYDHLLERRGHLTSEMAERIILKYLPVLITKTENTEINRRGHKVHHIPEERYSHIPIDFPLASTDLEVLPHSST